MTTLPSRTQGEVMENRLLAPGMMLMRVKARSIAETAQPGQFVMIRAGEADCLDPLLRRPFSINDVNRGRGTVDLIYKIVGRGTRIMATWRPTRTADLIGPLGSGFLPASAPHILVGGGLGIAPLLFLARTLMEANNGAWDGHVLLGGRNGAELTPLADLFPALGSGPKCATDDGSRGHHGLVTDLLEAVPATGTVYCCGPLPMMAAVAAICAERGHACQVSMETVMACGIKACLGCTVEAAATNSKGGRYLHVCQDGPVFAAEEIKW